jgi:hypothetical protein
VTIDCEFEEDTLRVLSNLKVCNPAVDTLVIVKPLLDADLKIFPKFFPNVTDLEITWFSNSDEDHVGWDFFDYSFEMELSPINSMKQVRKFEIDYMTEEMFDQLKLDQLQELHMSWNLDTDFLNEVWDEDLLQMVNWNWRTFINNHSQLKILYFPYCKVNVEQLQFALENMPLLKSLELTVKGYNCEEMPDLDDLFD